MKFERESDHIGKAMTEEQETGLLAACESNPLLRAVASLALNTALRKNEIRMLCWCQIDLIQRTLTVGRTKTEGGSGRTIPLNSVAYAARFAGPVGFPKRSRKSMCFRRARPRESSGSTPIRSASTRVDLSNRGDRRDAMH